MDNKFIVDFFCIGAMKSGTTYLYNLLNQIEEINLSKIKEPCYFTENKGKGIKWYKSLWSNKKGLKGEFTAHYIYNYKALKDIKMHNPNVKLIVVLRDPIKRAKSHMLHLKRIGKNQGNNYDCFLRKRIVERSLYAKYLEGLYHLYDESDVLIIGFENLINDPYLSIEKVMHFLGIKKWNHKIDLTKVKQGTGYIPRYLFVERVKERLYYTLVRLNMSNMINIIAGSWLSKIYKKVNSAKLKQRDISEMIDRDLEKYIGDIKDDVNNGINKGLLPHNVVENWKC